MESGAPAPELAAGAPPAAPARPDVGFVSRDEWDEKKRADGTKNEKAAENEAPVREQPAPPAEPTAGAPAAAPADEARRRNADELAALTRKHFAGEGESVRYVVFRDAAAAELFAASLAPEAASRAKDKAPAPTPAPLPPPTTASPGGGGAGGPAGAGKPPTPTPKPAAKKSGAGETATKLDERQAASADLLKQAAFAPRRVVSRTEALPLGEAELVARVAAAGGVVVPQADAQKFAELLDTAVHAEDDDAGEMKRRAGARGARAPDPAKPGAFEDGKEQAGGGSGALAGGKAAPKVVVVVVVLEPPPPPQPPAATPSNK
jgi:hypothetical protein